MPANRSKDYYATLGVGRDAKPDAIRKAYRHLARKLHPDVNPGDSLAENRFKDVQEAYDVLGDEKKRAFFDRHGFYSDQAFAGAPGGGPGGGGGGFGFDGFDFGRQASGRGADFDSIFDTFFGGSGRRAPGAAARERGEDLEYTLDIDFDEAIRGTTVRLDVQRQKACATCKGSGIAKGAPSRQCDTCNGQGQIHRAAGNMQFNMPCSDCRGRGTVANLCPDCGGAGRASASAPVEVRIPAGTQDNSRLRVPGKGNAGPGGGPDGDLYIVAKVGQHPFFQRKGNDIHIEMPITPSEAVLGAKIEVPTIDGTAFLRVPPATSSGKTFRVRERGVENPATKKRGDQFVSISIVVPEISDEATKDLMRQYADQNSENPRRAILESL